MLRKTDILCGKEYETPSCRTFSMNYQNVICNSLNSGGRETFGGFTDADDDFFE